ncbi:MAG: response regulator, partial [Spirochaetales bacterium]|nr:response regulator [Spirochaetales bacterium]
GIGIPEDQQERIFASFEQADTSISRKYGGSGLGVSICRELVSLMGGELRVSSRVGIGSDFHFTVPMTLPPENLDGVPARMEGHLSRLDSLDGVQVLLVEDYETNREIARHHLENAGCLVAHVENGRDALVYLDEGKPADLIFMDLHMPVMDGLGATEGIRRRGILTPIIGMTASAYAEDRLRCLSAGMDDFLTKPLRRADLLAKAVDWVAASSLGLSSPADSSFQDADFPATPSLPSSGSRDQVSEGGNVLVPAPAVLRYTDLLGEFDGEKDVVAELIDGFCEDVPSRFERAQKAFDDRDAESLHREAHSIKGGAMNLMADEMAEVALRLEKRAKATGSVVDEGLREGVKTALEELASAFERFREARCRMQENHETDQR